MVEYYKAIIDRYQLILNHRIRHYIAIVSNDYDKQSQKYAKAIDNVNRRAAESQVESVKKNKDKSYIQQLKNKFNGKVSSAFDVSSASDVSSSSASDVTIQIQDKNNIQDIIDDILRMSEEEKKIYRQEASDELKKLHYNKVELYLQPTDLELRFIFDSLWLAFFQPNKINLLGNNKNKNIEKEIEKLDSFYENDDYKKYYNNSKKILIELLQLD